MTFYRNKATGYLFIYLEDYTNDKALFVTPEGKIKPLELNLFEEMEYRGNEDLLSRDSIGEVQIRAYEEFIKNASSSYDDFDNTTKLSSGPIPDRKITENELIPHIIDVLRKHDGKARKTVVEEEIYIKFQIIFEQPWYQQTISNDVPRWKHFIAWAKEKAKHRGLIKYPNESGVGLWELT